VRKKYFLCTLFLKTTIKDTAMSKICQITGKSAMVGNNVSHSKRRTKRTFDINLFTKKFYWVEQDAWISLKVSANGLRVINKLGLNAAIKRAAEKGFL
jgi:large subunit ribosomal protein L28